MISMVWNTTNLNAQKWWDVMPRPCLYGETCALNSDTLIFTNSQIFPEEQTVFENQWLIQLLSKISFCPSCFLFTDISQLPCPSLHLLLTLSSWIPYSLQALELASQSSVYSVFHMPAPSLLLDSGCIDQHMLTQKDTLGKTVCSYISASQLSRLS